MISLTNHYSQWGRSEVVIIYPDMWMKLDFNHQQLWRAPAPIRGLQRGQPQVLVVAVAIVVADIAPILIATEQDDHPT